MIPDLLQPRPHKVIQQNIDKAWDFEAWDGFPKPRFPIFCSVCNGDDIILRSFHFHERMAKHRLKKNPYRCDVMVKCCSCSWSFVFGVVVTKELYAKMSGKRYERAEVLEILKEKGILTDDQSDI